MIDGKQDVPDGWELSTLGAVAALVKVKVDPAQSPDVPYVGLEHVEANTMRLLGHGMASDVKSTKTKFSAGDVLYGKLRPYLNKVARPDFDGICSTDLLVFTESPKVDTGYLANYLNQLWVADRAHHLSNGVELPRVDWESLSQLLIAYPPSKDDQRAIVSRINAIRQSQSSASAHFTSARRAIEHFRQTVLASACSGRLTVDWREINPAAQSIEYALAKIKSKRGMREVLNDLPLPDVPDSYVISTVGQVSVLLEYGTSKRADASNHGLPILRMGNIQNGHLELDDLKYAYVDSEIERLILQDGDLLFNRTNSPELVGKSAVFHEGKSMTFASYLIRVRFAPDVADPDFVNYWVNSAWGKAWARHVKTDGVSQSNINGSKLAAMPIPLPPIDEQQEIVRRGSQMLQLAETLLKRIDVATHAVERSSQAVLAKAFRGELSTATKEEQNVELPV